MEPSSSALVLYHLSKKFKACKAGRFQLLSCEIRYISMSLSHKIEAQGAVVNYGRSQGGSGRPREQSEGDLTCSAVIWLSADTGSVETLVSFTVRVQPSWGSSFSSFAGAFPTPAQQQPWLGRAGKCRTRSQPKAAAAASSECPVQSPGAASQSARAGLFILQTAPSSLSQPEGHGGMAEFIINWVKEQTIAGGDPGL